MKRRVEVGTDVARIGLWDESVNSVPISDLSMSEMEKAIAADTVHGRLFLVQLEGDWGGTVDVYVDSSLEPKHRKSMSACPGEFLLRSSSGRIVVGGVEDFRSSEPRITSDTSVVPVQAGDYGLKCYKRYADDGEVPDMPYPEEIEATVGRDLYAHYRTWNRRASRGFWLLLLIVPITYWFGWIVGILATLAIVFGFFHAVEWAQSRDAKYGKAAAAVEAAIASGRATMSPMFAFELRRLEDDHQLSGGQIEI